MRLRSDGLHWRQVDDEIVVLAGGRYLSIDGSGLDLWPLLAEGTDREALVAALVERYGIGADRAASDVDAFLAELVAKKLLE